MSGKPSGRPTSVGYLTRIIVTLLVETVLSFTIPAEALFAADLGGWPQPVLRSGYEPDPIYNWTGIYVGVTGGYGSAEGDSSNVGTTYSVNGGLFGGQIGYNWQVGQFIYGLEGGVDLTDLHGAANVAGCGMNQCSSKALVLTTIPMMRGRVGMAMNRWMPYFTAGLVAGDTRTTTSNAVGIQKVSQTTAGWTIGAGIEVALIANWSARVEYLYADFGTTRCAVYCGLGGTSFDLTTNAIRAGVNYRF
jgi:outer membrane immunogenic protein